MKVDATYGSATRKGSDAGSVSKQAAFGQATQKDAAAAHEEARAQWESVRDSAKDEQSKAAADKVVRHHEGERDRHNRLASDGGIAARDAGYESVIAGVLRGAK